jgi:hypothetical protein
MYYWIFNPTEYGSIMLAGASVGNGAVMQLLLQRDASIVITEDIVTAAAGNDRSGKEVIVTGRVDTGRAVRNREYQLDETRL